jgi:hypothetical protein
MSPSINTLEQFIATSYKETRCNVKKSTNFDPNSQRGVLKTDAQGNDGLFGRIISSGPKNQNTVGIPGK